MTAWGDASFIQSGYLFICCLHCIIKLPSAYLLNLLQVDKLDPSKAKCKMCLILHPSLCVCDQEMKHHAPTFQYYVRFTKLRLVQGGPSVASPTHMSDHCSPWVVSAPCASSHGRQLPAALTTSIYSLNSVSTSVNNILFHFLQDATACALCAQLGLWLLST